MIDIEQLYQRILTPCFPYFSKDSQEYIWGNSKYNRGGVLRWHLYYNDLCELGIIIKSSYKLDFISLNTRKVLLKKLYSHQIKFVKRVYNLGFITKDCYEYLSFFNCKLSNVVNAGIIKRFDYVCIGNVRTLISKE